MRIAKDGTVYRYDQCNFCAGQGYFYTTIYVQIPEEMCVVCHGTGKMEVAVPREYINAPEISKEELPF